MGRAGKNTHRNMLKSGTKEVQNRMPEPPEKKAVTNNVPQMKGVMNTPKTYANHPNC